MKKQEQAWVDWYLAEFETATRNGADGPIEDRVSWGLIEDKGIELKVIRTDEPGWFPRLQAEWKKLVPTKWCLEADTAIKRGEPIRRPGGSPKPKEKYVDLWADNRPY